MSHLAQPSCSNRRLGRGPVRYLSPVGSLGVLVLLALLQRQVHAQTLLKFDVPRQGGAYTVKVHPDVLTVLYFQGKVQMAYCLQNPAPLEVEQHTHSVTVRPLPGTQHGSVNVQTNAFPVGILFELVDRPEDAALQVEFRDRDLDREFEARVQLEVERRMLERERALEKREAALQVSKARFSQIVADTAVQRVADGIRTHHGVVALDEGARKEHVVLRVERVVWLGADAYVFFSLENRRPTAYRLGDLTLRVGAQERTGAVSFPDRENAARRGIVGIVPAHDTQAGVVVLRDAAGWLGEMVSLHAVEDRAQGAKAGLPLTASFFLHQ